MARHQLRGLRALGLLPRGHDLGLDLKGSGTEGEVRRRFGYINGDSLAVIPRQVSACVGRSGSSSREDPFVERAIRDEVADEEARAGGDATVAEEANEVHVTNAG
ncbi:hypothetical protein U1Q18_001663 [Sarracenia purpurea var. burkii]